MSAVRVLVVGAIGLIGRPAALRLASDGFDVRLLVRDATRARRLLGPDFEYFVAEQDSVERAACGCDGVHISLAATNREDFDRIEHQGTARIAKAASASGVSLLSYLTGSLVHEEYGKTISEHRAKLAAEHGCSEHRQRRCRSGARSRRQRR